MNPVVFCLFCYGMQKKSGSGHGPRAALQEQRLADNDHPLLFA